MTRNTYRIKWGHSSVVYSVNETEHTVNGIPVRDPIMKLFTMAGPTGVVEERVPGGWEPLPRQMELFA